MGEGRLDPRGPTVGPRGDLAAEALQRLVEPQDMGHAGAVLRAGFGGAERLLAERGQTHPTGGRQFGPVMQRLGAHDRGAAAQLRRRVGMRENHGPRAPRDGLRPAGVAVVEPRDPPSGRLDAAKVIRKVDVGRAEEQKPPPGQSPLVW